MIKETIDSEEALKGYINSRVEVIELDYSYQILDEGKVIKEFDITSDVKADAFVAGYKTALMNGLEEVQASRFSVDALVSVRDLKELIKMWKESSKIPAMIGESKETIAAKNIIYAECCRELKQLINGDKSVIEKL